MKTIEMYQNPKTGIYESLQDLAERSGIKVVYVIERSTLEEISEVLSFVGMATMSMPSINSLLNFDRQNKYDKPEYKTERNTGRPLRGNPMPREIKHSIKRRYGRWIK
jgi:hypothetical protein